MPGNNYNEVPFAYYKESMETVKNVFGTYSYYFCTLSVLRNLETREASRKEAAMLINLSHAPRVHPVRAKRRLISRGTIARA